MITLRKSSKLLACPPPEAHSAATFLSSANRAGWSTKPLSLSWKPVWRFTTPHFSRSRSRRCGTKSALMDYLPLILRLGRAGWTQIPTELLGSTCCRQHNHDVGILS